MKNKYLTNWYIDGQKTDIILSTVCGGINVYQTDDSFYILGTGSSFTSDDMTILELKYQTALLSPDGVTTLIAYKIPKMNDNNGILIGGNFLIFGDAEYYVTIYDAPTLNSIEICRVGADNKIKINGIAYSASIYRRSPQFGEPKDNCLFVNNEQYTLERQFNIDGESTKLDHIITIEKNVAPHTHGVMYASAHVFKAEKNYFVLFDGWLPESDYGCDEATLSLDGQDISFAKFHTDYPLLINADDTRDSYLILDGDAYYSNTTNKECVDTQVTRGALINYIK